MTPFVGVQTRCWSYAPRSPKQRSYGFTDHTARPSPRGDRPWPRACRLRTGPLFRPRLCCGDVPVSPPNKTEKRRQPVFCRTCSWATRPHLIGRLDEKAAGLDWVGLSRPKRSTSTGMTSELSTSRHMSTPFRKDQCPNQF